MSAETLWPAASVARLAGASYRQLDYWTRCGWLGDIAAFGSGTPRAYSRTQIRRVQVLAAASAAGINPRIITTRLDDVDTADEATVIFRLPITASASVTIRIEPLP